MKELLENTKIPSLMGVKRVDHGNVFNTGHWYTFYCPNCSIQLVKNGDCPQCGQKIDWSVNIKSTDK